jgi:dTDP-4-dehydrorhamnose reductase
MTKILVTGSNGQLGSELQEMADSFPSYRFLFTDVAELDITDAGAVNSLFMLERPDVVINCAAYTAVDKAEDEEHAARRLNAEAAGLLASASASCHALMVHISTDYIFNGRATRPITEDDKPEPASVYGLTKLEGESEVSSKALKAVIIRTSWLYSSHGHNFVKTILKYGRERGSLDVVNDQAGTPTYARDLAGTILALLPQMQEIRGTEIFNYSNEGVTTWYEFAKEILALKGVHCIVNPILTKDYPTKAPRPAYSVLSKQKIRERFGMAIPEWNESLKECLKKIE